MASAAISDHGAGMKRNLENANQTAFLAEYAACGSISEAAEKADVARGRHYAWLKEDETYAARFEDAHQQYCDSIESEIRRRGRDGIERPIVYQGQFTYEPLRNRDGSVRVDEHGKPMLSKKPLTIREYSDNLLMFHAKRHMPELYRENFKGELSGPGGAPLALQVTFVKPPKE
jgi:hypothetical protein